MTFDERRRDYDAATGEFLALANSVDDTLVDRHVEGGWSARQVMHHMADSEMQSAVRLRRLVAEAPGSSIQGYDEEAWAQNPALGYQTSDWRPALQLIAAVRSSSSAVLSRLTDADLAREGIHTESGRYTLDQWLDIYTRHPREHAAQMREAMGL